VTLYVAAKRRRVDKDEERERLIEALPRWSDKAMSAADEMVFRDADGSGVFFQDARRRYEFRCGRRGLALLVALRRESDKTLSLLEDELSRLDPAERARILEEGRRIYAEKPSLRKFEEKNKNVTWSDDEYAHAGLRAQYLRLKSIQRFSETFNLLHRASVADAHARDLLAATHIRCASLGGGPAFELFALREFCPDAALELYSLDLQPAWRVYAEALGCKFAAPFDVHKVLADDLVRACDDKPLDILVVSYLLIYCTNARTADLLADLLKRRLVRLLVISERTRDQGIVPLLRQRDIHVLPLLSQDREPDFRQLIALLPADRSPLQPPREADYIHFPNVPFARGT